MNCRQIMKRKSEHARARAWMHNVGEPLVREVVAKAMRHIFEKFLGRIDDARWTEIRNNWKPSPL